MRKIMTKKEVIKKYGELDLKFSGYYKYSFTYEYNDKKLSIIGNFGGCSEDMYRKSVGRDDKIKVKDFEDELHSLVITENNKEIFEYNDY